MTRSADSTTTPIASTDELMTTLEATYQQMARGAFADALEAFDWSSLSAAQINHALDLAISLDLVTLARALANRGAQHYPTDERLQRAMRVLAPPQVLEETPADPKFARSMRMSAQWLRENAKLYRGKWVAIRDGVLVGVGDTFDQLLPVLGDKEPSARTLVEQVPR